MLPCGLVVRIPGFHPGGPGSIPGMGTFFILFSKTLLHQIHSNTLQKCDIAILDAFSHFFSERRVEISRFRTSESIWHSREDILGGGV